MIDQTQQPRTAHKKSVFPLVLRDESHVLPGMVSVRVEQSSSMFAHCIILYALHAQQPSLHRPQGRCQLDDNEREVILFDAARKTQDYEHALDILCKGKNPTAVLVSHFHPEHIGLLPLLQSKGADIFACDPVVPSDVTLGNSFIAAAGVPLDLHTHAVESWTSFALKSLNEYCSYIPLGPCDVLELGEYVFRALHTPGHAYEHMCYYEEQYKVLYAGDLLIPNMLSSVQSEGLGKRRLEHQLKSINRIIELKPEVLLSSHAEALIGHENIISLAHTTKEEYLNHAREILACINTGYVVTAWSLAQRLFGNSLKNKDLRWQGLQVSKVLSYLEYLYELDCIGRNFDGGIAYYYKKPQKRIRKTLVEGISRPRTPQEEQSYQENCGQSALQKAQYVMAEHEGNADDEAYE